MTDQHTVLAWVSKAAVYRYADTNGIVVSDEQPEPYDFDQVSAFANALTEITARETVDAWNLFVDIARSIGADDFLSAEREQLDLYNHLFYLTGAAPVKDTYPDPLSPSERGAARRILALGLEVLEKHLRVQK